MPSTRMSLTTNGSKACAGAEDKANRADATRLPIKVFFMESTEELYELPTQTFQTTQVIEYGNAHHEQQKHQANSLPGLESSLRQGLPAQKLRQIIHQMPPIQHRYGQEIQYPDTEAEKGQKTEKRADSKLNRIPRDFGNRDRTGKILQGCIADQHLADHPQTE